MNNKEDLKFFNDTQIRTHWSDEEEKWYVSIVDVIAVLTESVDANAYWRKLKQRLKEEGNETVTNCHGLKMLASDGKMRMTDVADVEQLFRLIQSIPSPKAEPFKLWLAQIANERIDEMQDPELSIDRALEQYLKLGYSESWINQRLKSIEISSEVTKMPVLKIDGKRHRDAFDAISKYLLDSYNIVVDPTSVNVSRRYVPELYEEMKNFEL